MSPKVTPVQLIPIAFGYCYTDATGTKQIRAALFSTKDLLQADAVALAKAQPNAPLNMGVFEISFPT